MNLIFQTSYKTIYNSIRFKMIKFNPKLINKTHKKLLTSERIQCACPEAESAGTCCPRPGRTVCSGAEWRAHFRQRLGPSGLSEELSLVTTTNTHMPPKPLSV